MSGFTTHVLDTVSGGGARGIALTLRARILPEAAFREVAEARTDTNGRALLLGSEAIVPGLYELAFETLSYHQAAGHESFFEEVVLRVLVEEPGGSWHLPIILSPAAFSAYRGGVPPADLAGLPPEMVA
ncbi:hydroxyisourate hydrolase [uncultured Enterovirga sp.]|uniref:hydroxyisourate hydrolase n=1 Tax=uncultured Enterovirga sp. TaxID=2026352 RepID=UPI0035CBEAB8